MWRPKDEGLIELLNLFRDCKSKDNTKQKEIYNKLNEYSNHSEFPNYLIYILNSTNEDAEIRQVAGLTLKAIMERSFVSISDVSIEYFKDNILNCYFDNNHSIRKTISSLINTFIIYGGTDIWPEIFKFLLTNLDTLQGAEMSIETLNYIIEDSGSSLQEKQQNYLYNLLSKLTNYLNNILDQTTHLDNPKLINLILSTIYLLLENCPSIVSQDLQIISKVLLNLNNIENFSIRYNIARCWLTIVRINREVLYESNELLFNFFINNLTFEYYDMNFISAEFFLFIIDDEDTFNTNLHYKLIDRENIHLNLENILNK